MAPSPQYTNSRSIWDNLAAVETVVAAEPLGLFTDVDGTISEISPSPDEASVSPHARYALASLCRKIGVVAAISGRSAAAVERMVGVEGIVYIGNHGLERRKHGRTLLTIKDSRRTRNDIADVENELTRSLGPMVGLLYENKGLSLSVHYRQCLRPEDVAPQLIAKAREYATSKGLSVRTGKMVLEVRPQAASKGSAVTRISKQYRLGSAIYIGDDDTDVDAFNALHSLDGEKGFQGLSIAVGGTETPSHVLSAADFHLEGVDAVARFLNWLDNRVTEAD